MRTALTISQIWHTVFWGGEQEKVLERKLGVRFVESLVYSDGDLCLTPGPLKVPSKEAIIIRID